MPIPGQVVASFGRRYLVEADDGRILACVTRGKKGGLACGDLVTVEVRPGHEPVIDRTLPRRTLLYRADRYKEKILAANVDQALLVIAAEPHPSEEFITRALIAAEAADIDIVVVQNKIDLPGADALAAGILHTLSALGYRCVRISARAGAEELRSLLAGKANVLVGQSGMGKSTIVNALHPEANAREGEISRALNSGRHTTTHARLYHLDDDTSLIDCPGVETFGIQHLEHDAIAHAFLEFRPLLGNCRFNDCRHRAEPGCAILTAALEGRIHPDRLAAYHRILEEPRLPEWAQPERPDGH